MLTAAPALSESPAPLTAPPRTYSLRREVLVQRSPEETFAFFADAANLELLTPPWLNFRILTPRPISMRPGTLIDYRISLRGIPLRWTTLIELWEPGRRFVDLQLRGPYRWWRHEHRFTPVDRGTLVEDIIEYLPPFHRLTRALVRRDLDRIFNYRTRRIHDLLTPTPPLTPVAASHAG